jgi:DNA-binding phage protein
MRAGFIFRRRKGKGDFKKKQKIREMETSKFDIADYLDSNEMIAEYLNAVLAEGNDSDVIPFHIESILHFGQYVQQLAIMFKFVSVY